MSLDAVADARYRAMVLATDPQFGAVGDGIHDDTAALQSWLNYIVTNHRTGFLPNPPGGYYRISAPLTTRENPSWQIIGESRHYTIIRQYANNVPVLDLGGNRTGATGMHSVVLSSFKLDYNQQQTGNTSATCLLFTGSPYECAFQNMAFNMGFDGIKVAPGIVPAWGCVFDQLWFQGELCGGAINESAGSTAGAPNRRFGHLYVSAGSMTSPYVFQLQGAQNVLGNIEVNQAWNGVGLLSVASGSHTMIDSIVLEEGTYTADRALIRFETNCHYDIRHVNVFQSNPPSLFAPATGTLRIIQHGNGSKGHIGSVAASATVGLSGECVVASIGSLFCGHLEIDNLSLSGGWELLQYTSTETSNRVKVTSWTNGRMSANKGDADYTFAVGDETTVLYRSAFTAPRTLTLPSVTSRNLHSGLTIRVVLDGAVNGSNTLTVKQGSSTIRTQTDDKRALEFCYRRGLGWVLVGYETLP